MTAVEYAVTVPVVALIVIGLVIMWDELEKRK